MNQTLTTSLVIIFRSFFDEELRQTKILGGFFIILTNEEIDKIVFDETGYTWTPAPPPIPSLHFYFLLLKTPPVIIFSSFPVKLIRLCLVKSLMKPIHLMAPNPDYLPRWSPSKPMTSTTITQAYNLNPFLFISGLSLVFKHFPFLYTF